MGDGEAARDLFAKSLQIRERLAAAEPDRADYQFDLVVSLQRIASVTPESAPANLRRCLDILRALAAEDRLTPDQEKWIAHFEVQLAELGKASHRGPRRRLARILSWLSPSRRKNR